MSDITVVVNGEVLKVAAESTVFDLLKILQITDQRIAVERNGEFLDQGSDISTILKDGDKLELVRFVGGG